MVPTCVVGERKDEGRMLRKDGHVGKEEGK